MKLRDKIRKGIKWTTLALTAVLMFCWIGSGWYYAVVWFGPEGTQRIQITGGVMKFEYWGDFDLKLASSRVGFGRVYKPDARFRWWFVFESPPPQRQPRLGKASTPGTIQLPLWMPVLCAVTISATTWRLDRVASRRARTNHCTKCGYHRAGLKSDAACPECGTSISA